MPFARVSATFVLMLLCALAAGCGSSKSPSGSTGTDAGTDGGTPATCVFDDGRSTFDGPCVLAK